MIGVTGRERVLYFQPGSGAVIGSTPGAILRPSMTRGTRVTYPRRGMYLDVRLASGSVRFGRYFAVRGQDGPHARPLVAHDRHLGGRVNPPDTSRGHTPILALFLANPGRALTANEIREHLPTLSEKSLVTSLGQLRFSGALIRTDTQYTAATPFPPSRRERHTERERERRAAHRAANPAPRTPIPKADTGYTSAAARKARQDETIRKRAVKSAALQDQILAILLTDPKRRWSDSELFAQLTGAAALKRQALSTLMVDNRLHYACSPLVDQRGYEYWSAQPVPTPAKPIKYTRTHIELHALLTRSTYTLGSLARRAERAMTISQKRVLVLVEELRCGGYASYHPVGATVIVRPGPAPTITQESAHATAA